MQATADNVSLWRPNFRELSGSKIHVCYFFVQHMVLFRVTLLLTCASCPSPWCTEEDLRQNNMYYRHSVLHVINSMNQAQCCTMTLSPKRRELHQSACTRVVKMHVPPRSFATQWHHRGACMNPRHDTGTMHMPNSHCSPGQGTAATTFDVLGTQDFTFQARLQAINAMVWHERYAGM